MGDALDNTEDIEIHMYDLAQCFDSMWWQQTCNDLYDKKICNDKFALVA